MLYKKSSKPSILSKGFVLLRPLWNQPLSNEIKKAKLFEKKKKYGINRLFW